MTVGEIELDHQHLADLEQQIGSEKGPPARDVCGGETDRPPDLLGCVRDHHRNLELSANVLS
jgi:hypothetical protein